MIQAYGASDVGRFRKTNEDRFVSDPEVRFFAVADGMGGHSAGEVASRLAIETICAFIRRSERDPDFTWPYGVDGALSLDGNRLNTAIRLANRCIYDAAEKSDDYSGMGTTFAGLLLNDSRVTIGHVGDSRLYLLSGGELRQLTQDDSWAALMFARDPTLAADDIAFHPMRNVLTNVLGTQQQVEVHLSEQALQSGDVLLLCTDGVHGVLDSDTLRDLLGQRLAVDATARILLNTAMDRGSRDNVTALVVRFEAEP